MSTGHSSAEATPPDAIDLTALMGEHPLGREPRGVEIDRMHASLRTRLLGQPAATKLGRYTLLEPIGRGGMGVVYAAYDPQLDRKVALKVVRPDRDGPEERIRLLDEARALAQLSHPNVVTVFEVGELADRGDVYLAMEFLDGGTLDDWVEAHAGAPKHWREVTAIFTEIGRGLVAAHAAGIVHRDFKPTNVLLGDDARPRVVDFGLARTNAPKLETRDDGRDGTTGVAGTPGYMSPEQRQGRKADERSDQFSFCVALFEALFGVRVEVQTRRPPAPDGVQTVPAAIVEALLRGLSPRRDDRFDTMAELLDAIALPSAKRRGRAAVGVALVGALVAGAAGSTLVDADPTDPCAALRGEVAGAWTLRGGQSLATSLDAAAMAQRGALHGELNNLCDGAPSPEAIAAPLACLRRSALSLRAVDQAVGEGGVELRRALDVVVQLPRPQQCTDPSRRASEPPLPVDPQRLERAQTIRDALASAKVDALIGREDRADAAARSALTDSAEIDDRVAEAQAHHLLALIASRSGRGPDAEAAHRQAALAAERAGYDWLRATAVIDHAGVLAHQLGRLDEADAQLAVAAAITDRLGHPADLVEVLHTMRGMVHYSRGQPKEAVALLVAAIAATESRLGPNDFALVRPLNALGASYIALEQFDDGIAAFARVRTIVDTHYGRSHPLYSRVLSNLGAASRDAGHLESAMAYLTEALERGIALHGESHPAVVVAMHNLADVHSKLGDHDQAVALARRAVKVSQEVHGTTHPEVRWALGTLASVEAKAGQVEAARATIARAEQLVVAEWGADAVQLLPALAFRRWLEDEAGRSTQRDAITTRMSTIASLHDAELPPGVPDG